MKSGEFLDSAALCKKGIDEDCIIHNIKKNSDKSITIEFRINAYNIDKEDDCYTGVSRMRLKQEGGKEE